MNIQEAKEEIKRTLRVYTRKDAEGHYQIPGVRQRPILLIGPPGIGKTAIMEQIADETGMGLVSYTMTHHTRQSAIGLPFIHQREFQGQTYSVTEYTMSEIIASLYRYMEDTGHREGILFLDEINCVSETLAPVMLQLLQNKTFGNHPLPEGWLIVAAGNPPEYNKSVREMDMVTLDRVRNMDVEADLPIWQSYASRRRIHPAIRSYLTVYPDHFYQIENSARGQQFVTARGWEDLSVLLQSYEEAGETVEDSLFLQYLRHDAIAHSFCLYYRLFCKYSRSDIADLLEQLENSDSLLKQGEPAEILAVTSMLFHQIQEYSDAWLLSSRSLQRFCELLDQIPQDGSSAEFFRSHRDALKLKHQHGLLSTEEEFAEEQLLRDLEQKNLAEQLARTYHVQNAEDADALEKELIFRREGEKAARQQTLAEQAETIVHNMDITYRLLETSRSAHLALLFFTTDLTNDEGCRQVLLSCPSEYYRRYAAELLDSLVH